MYLTIPDRLEEGVAEAKSEQVLDGFLTQIVVDAKDLTLVERPHHLLVQSLRALQVPPEGLFDDARSCWRLRESFALSSPSPPG